MKTLNIHLLSGNIIHVEKFEKIQVLSGKTFTIDNFKDFYLSEGHSYTITGANTTVKVISNNVLALLLV